MSIMDRLNEFLLRPYFSEEACVSFRLDESTYIEVLNKAIAKASVREERLSLTKDLFRLWLKTDQREREARSIFNKAIEIRKSKRIFMTLTGTGKQLRVWHEKPGFISPDHVDSCGEGLIFGVYGGPKEVEEYLIALLEVHPLQKLDVPNGGKVYVEGGQKVEFDRLGYTKEYHIKVVE